MVPVRMLDDADVIGYFHSKQEDLTAALEQGRWDEPCDNRECWDGVRCRDYCEVWQYCPKGLIEHGGG